MKRIRMWLRELSLSQQLLTIIFIFISVFIGFIIIVLGPAIENFSTSEMYRLLHSSQETIVSFLDTHPGEIPDMGDAMDAQIAQVIYDVDNKNLISLCRVKIDDEVEKDIISHANSDLKKQTDYTVTLKDVNESGDVVRYLYTMDRLEDGRYLVSLMNDSYRQSFASSLSSGVIMINVLFVSALFVLLMVWVGSLIIPLNQIKLYIKKVKNDEPATLYVRRNDEIGEVADALVGMEQQLSKESREKQEMIQNISHDLKTPIATIKSYSEAIKDGIYPYETLEKSVDVIIEHANRLEKKVKSLIILNKMDYLLDQCEEGDNLLIYPIVDKVLLSLKVIRPEIKYVSEIDKSVKFHGEEEPWRILIENLIDNALRYAETTITIKLKPNDLQVINDGKTIPQDRLLALFHPYEKGTDGQFGLGLSIVYKVCQTYGYHVQAENLTHGVCFHIWCEPKKKSRNKRKQGQS